MVWVWKSIGTEVCEPGLICGATSLASPECGVDILAKRCSSLRCHRSLLLEAPERLVAIRDIFEGHVTSFR